MFSLSQIAANRLFFNLWALLQACHHTISLLTGLKSTGFLTAPNQALLMILTITIQNGSRLTSEKGGGSQVILVTFITWFHWRICSSRFFISGSPDCAGFLFNTSSFGFPNASFSSFSILQGEMECYYIKTNSQTCRKDPQLVPEGVIILTKGLPRDQIWVLSITHSEHMSVPPPRCSPTANWYLHLLNSSWYCIKAQKGPLCVHSSQIQTLLQKHI